MLSQSQAFPPPQRSVHLEKGQEPFMIHCTTKPAMPPKQQRIPSFSSHNRERIVMQNLLWDQVTCSSPAKNTAGICCVGSFSRSTGWGLRKHPGIRHRAALGLEMDQGEVSQRVRTRRVASSLLEFAGLCTHVCNCRAAPTTSVKVNLYKQRIAFKTKEVIPEVFCMLFEPSVPASGQAPAPVV